MKLNNILTFSLLSLFFLITPLQAQPLPNVNQPDQKSSVITLRDGTVIKGRVVGFRDGVYSVRTGSIGEIGIHADNILSINAQDAAPIAAVGSPAAANQQQATALQQQLLSDPEVMADIQVLAQDPEFMKLLSDPEFVKALMAGDPEKIKDDPRIPALMQNPKIQALMLKVGQKMGTAQQQVPASQ